MSGWPWSRQPTLALGQFGPGFWPRSLRLPVAELHSHLRISGVTGTGKTRLLAHLFLQLFSQGQAVTLLDPHGDAARLVLSELVSRGVYRDPRALERLIYLDLPAAMAAGRYPAFNVLCQPHLDRHTTTRSVLEGLRRAWPSLDHGQAPTFENVILAGVFVLCCNGLPLTRLHDVLVNTAWREELLRQVEDEAVREFFQARFARWGREQALMVESSLRRIFLLSFSPMLRHSLEQPDNLLDARRLMDQGRSLIVNLALPDPDARRLLGCLLTVGFEQASLSRATQPADERGPQHFLLLDEFAEFASQSGENLTRILALCRKFGLSLALAHQTWDQPGAALQDALQNVGLTITFRLGRADAERAARMFGRVDPLVIKHPVGKGSEGYVHPLFSPLAEQWETSWVQTLQELPARSFMLRKADGTVSRLRTPELRPTNRMTAELREVEAQYLSRYFRAPGDTRRPASAAPPRHQHTRRMAPVDLADHINAEMAG